MENNKDKKSVKFQGDMLNFYDFIQVFIFTTNHHLNQCFSIERNTIIVSYCFFSWLRYVVVAIREYCFHYCLALEVTYVTIIFHFTCTRYRLGILFFAIWVSE